MAENTISKIVEDLLIADSEKEAVSEHNSGLLFAHMYVKKELHRRMELLDSKRPKKKRTSAKKGGEKDDPVSESEEKGQSPSSPQTRDNSKEYSPLVIPGTVKEELSETEEFSDTEDVSTRGSSPPARKRTAEEIDIEIKEEEIDDFEFFPCDVSPKDHDEEDDDDTDEEEDEDYELKDDEALVIDEDYAPTASSEESLMPQLLQHLLASPSSALSVDEVKSREFLASRLLMNIAQGATLSEVSRLAANEASPLDLRLTSKSGDVAFIPIAPKIDILKLQQNAKAAALLLDHPCKSPLQQNTESDALLLDSPCKSPLSGSPPLKESSSSVMTDQELVSLTVRELNRRICRLPKALQNDLKRRRRTLKNRTYAQNSRTKRTQYQQHLKTIIKHLRKENSETREEVNRLSQQIILYKSENTLLKDDILNLKIQLRTTLNELERVKQQSSRCHKCKSACPDAVLEKDQPESASEIPTELSSEDTTED
ncbi:uncharacterized protein LOC135214700 [Macrobrachium nipponense]|uniref:uncharacterized protein LOC135214700 n=1 Tax=Macrobrachium nipponense TaxID=159736 RepID=UPI0030C86D08